MADWRDALTHEVMAHVQLLRGGSVDDAWREACAAWRGLCGRAVAYDRIMAMLDAPPSERVVADALVAILDDVFHDDERPSASAN